MAIQPIDLQTLFSQMDKVAKTQAAEKEGVQLQQALVSAQNQKKSEERVRSVNGAQDAGEGAERVKDKQKRKPDDKAKEGNADGAGENEDEEAPATEVVRDPDLGRNIDVSG